MFRRQRRIKVSVVVPAYNEEENIDKLLAEFDKTFRERRLPAEVIMVNDGSTDKTGEKIAAAIRRYRFVRQVRNRVRMGLTKALIKGFAAADGDILVFYPADLQFHPRDVPRMVTAIDNGADMICGRKVGRYGKRLVSLFYNCLTRLLFPRLKVSDMNSVKAFRREVYNDFPTLREGWHRYLAVFAVARGYLVREIPVTLYRRHSGKSKFSGKGRILKGLTDLIAIKFQVSVLGDPMHLFGKISLLLFLGGLIAAAIAFYYRFVLGEGYRPILYIIMLFGISGLITFVMGIILETLVYLRDSLTEVRDKNEQLAGEIDRLTNLISKQKGGSETTATTHSNHQRPERKARRKRTPRRNGDKTGATQLEIRPLPASPTEKQDET
ncbi:MAG: glycosyltransferase family 2 protein [candidate division Zixibacteria bacterium]|nr:glycosyltransferase family 2 protein [candidate division Zixibacteria bacterium]